MQLSCNNTILFFIMQQSCIIFVSWALQDLDKLKDDGIIHSFIGKSGLKWYAKCHNCSHDTHNDVHPHFQCKTCGAVECLSVSFTLPSIKNYKIDSASLFIQGQCSSCTQ